MYVHHVCLVPTETKRALDPLELELQVVVNLHVGAANEPLTSARAASVLNQKLSFRPQATVSSQWNRLNTRDTLSDILL